jgi:hypothetical protein
MNNSRTKVKIDLWVSIILWLNTGIFVALAFVIPPSEFWIYLVFVFPILILMLWILFGSYYELREDLLFLKIGPFFGRIKYENIKSLELKNNWLSSMALSYHRIEIKEHKKGYIMGTTMISPINREEFLEELKRRCYNLEK